jgi:Tol biopolymer transport system component
MNPDGSDQTRLTNNTAKDFSPAFSPDGKKIVFASDRGGNEDIYTMNADGSGAVAVALAPAAGFDGTPEWSHDGKWIVFHSRRDGGKAEIYVMKADGSKLKRLTTNDAADVYPAFSADGKKIVFQSDRDGYKDLYVMNADGTGQTRLINPPPAVHASNGLK